MKKYISLFLAISIIGSLYSMNEQVEASVEENKAIGTPFYTATMRLLIIEALLKITSDKEAFKTFKSWSFVDKKSLGIFKDKERLSVDFLKSLYNISYYYGFDVSLLKSIYSLLNEKACIAYKLDLFISDSLVTLFQKCAHAKQWSQALKMLSKVKTCSIINPFQNYYFKGSCYNVPAKKNLLMYALELEAPEEVIEFLVNKRSFPERLHPTTPSAFFVVFYKMLEQDMILAGIASEEEPDYNYDLEEFVLSKCRYLENIMAMLIEKGASLHDSFCFLHNLRSYYVTLLELAIAGNNVSKMEYLLEKGACLTCDALRLILGMPSSESKFWKVWEILLQVIPSESLLKELTSSLMHCENSYTISEECKRKLEAADIPLKEGLGLYYLYVLRRKSLRSQPFSFPTGYLV